MAFSLTQFSLPPATKPQSSKYPSPFKLTQNPLSNSTKNHRYAVVCNAAEDQQQKPTSESSEPTQQQQPSDEQLSELGSEIKKAMMDREVIKKDESLWTGVVEEIGQIEWPAFNKVLGTTGVVLGVIAGSSVVLLTFNAVLAELSDRVFAGRGVQDFFG
ncbi:LOW QUALITY PROTEIN: preprotein translocase subunit SECE1 [Bidens hawaiensis]|uniref:LOW QUALITY PROTEIN: preprotein translocase subunit SECE1 n=1 Tax=Bidens hawaiensis TaxID=980011 RepID=UPI004049CF29